MRAREHQKIRDQRRGERDVFALAKDPERISGNGKSTLLGANIAQRIPSPREGASSCRSQVRKHGVGSSAPVPEAAQYRESSDREIFAQLPQEIFLGLNQGRLQPADRSRRLRASQREKEYRLT